MAKSRSKKSKKRSFCGNRHTISHVDNAEGFVTASSSKLKIPEDMEKIAAENDQGLKGNRIFDVETLFYIFSILSCPICFKTGLQLNEDSRFGLCSNFSLVCKCGYIKGFTSTTKENNKNTLNSLLVFGLRLIGKGYTAGKKLLFTLNLPFTSKTTFRRHETKLLEAVQFASDQNMEQASREIKDKNKSIACGVSVDGTWQRRGHTSLNGCVSVISIDTGKVLDIQVMSKYCRICEGDDNNTTDHICSNHKGSAGSMEVAGAYKIFERSEKTRSLKYTEYYGDGDSKAYMGVKDIYGRDSVKKLECIGHVQKRVGTRLRNLKKSKKGLGGKGKLTDKFIDKLQNYYGIAIRSTTGSLQNMQSAVIAAFFHCCSNRKNEMHGQCPKGSESWCKYQRALSTGLKILDNSAGLPPSIIKIIKPTYMSLCDASLLSKCLHGKTQNSNESFNNVIWTILPKETFVEMQTMMLGVKLAVLIYNSGYLGLLPVFEQLGVSVEQNMITNYFKIDDERIKNSKRHSLSSAKLTRKTKRATKKLKMVKYEVKNGLEYKCGAF